MLCQLEILLGILGGGSSKATFLKMNVPMMNMLTPIAQTKWLASERGRESLSLAQAV